MRVPDRVGGQRGRIRAGRGREPGRLPQHSARPTAILPHPAVLVPRQSAAPPVRPGH